MIEWLFEFGFYWFFVAYGAGLVLALTILALVRRSVVLYF